jgi:hypothetical protein
MGQDHHSGRSVRACTTAPACTTALYDSRPVERACTTGSRPEDTLARIDGIRGQDTRSAWLLRLIDRELTGQTATPAPASPSLAALPDGEPSPGVLSMGPGCWEHSTSKYGLRKLPLCPAYAAALQGQREYGTNNGWC